MKRKVFKKWVNWLVIGIMILGVMILAGECDDTLMFVASKGIGMIILFITYKLLVKYGRGEVL